MLTDMPVIPIYFYTTRHMIADKVQGWQDNLLDYHPTQYLRLAQ